MAKRRKTRLKHLAAKAAAGERVIGMECHDTSKRAIMAEELGVGLLCCGSPGTKTHQHTESGATSSPCHDIPSENRRLVNTN